MYRSDDDEIRTRLVSLREEYRRDAEQEIDAAGALSAKQSAYEYASSFVLLFGLIAVGSARQWACQLPLDHARSGLLMLIGMGFYLLFALLWFSLFYVFGALFRWRYRLRLSWYLRPSNDARRDLEKLQQEPRVMLRTLSGGFNRRALLALGILALFLHLCFGFIPFCPEYETPGLSSLELSFFWACLLSFLFEPLASIAFWLFGLLSLFIFSVCYVVGQYYLSERFPELGALYVINSTILLVVILFFSWVSRSVQASWEHPAEPEPTTSELEVGRCYLGD